MRIGSVSGIAGRGDFSLIRPVPDAETLPNSKKKKNEKKKKTNKNMYAHL